MINWITGYFLSVYGKIPFEYFLKQRWHFKLSEYHRTRCRAAWFVYLSKGNLYSQTLVIMAQITVKTLNPKCRRYWCLIEFIDWRYDQSCWYFRSLLWSSSTLTFSLVDLPGVWISTGYVFIQCVTGGRGWDQVVWRASTGVIHCVFDQIPNLQNCFTTPNKNLRGEGASDR